MKSSALILAWTLVGAILPAAAQTIAPNPSTDIIALENARFAQRLQASVIAVAGQAAQSLDDRAQYAHDLAGQVRTGTVGPQAKDAAVAALGAPIVNQIQQHPAAAAKALSQISQSASKLADQVRSLANNLSGASATQTLQLLGAGIDQKKLDNVFPALAPNASNGLAPYAKEQAADVTDIYTRTGAYATGGPSIEFASVGLLLMIDPGQGRQFAPECTVTLVGPRKMVTAGHCFCPVPDGGEMTKQQCDQSIAATPNFLAQYKIFFQQAGLFDIDAFKVSDMYDVGTRQDGSRVDQGDISTITLAPTTENGIALSVIDTNANPVATRIVGFGAGFAPNAPGISTVGENPSPPGLKLWSVASLSPCVHPFQAPDALCWQSGPDLQSSSGAICPGDSGGPMLLGARAPTAGAERLVGVNSAATSKDCAIDNEDADANFGQAVNRAFLTAEFPAPPASVSDPMILAHNEIDILDATGVSKPYPVYVGDKLKTLVITTNGFVRSNLKLEVLDKNGMKACTSQGSSTRNLPSVDACIISVPEQNSTYMVRVHGNPQAAMQILATGY